MLVLIQSLIEFIVSEILQNKHDALAISSIKFEQYSRTIFLLKDKI